MNEPVLIVDDNASNQKLLAFLLARRGYEVRTADSALQALATLLVFEPRLILLDLQMPVTDGYTLARTLKSSVRWKDIPLLAVTAYAMKGDEARAREAGFDEYVTKPIDTRTFPVVVARIIAAHERLSEASTPNADQG